MKDAKDIDEIPCITEARNKKVITKISFDYSNIQKHWKENINDVENKFSIAKSLGKMNKESTVLQYIQEIKAFISDIDSKILSK